jgi:hypothetical protein
LLHRYAPTLFETASVREILQDLLAKLAFRRHAGESHAPRPLKRTQRLPVFFATPLFYPALCHPKSHRHSTRSRTDRRDEWG